MKANTSYHQHEPLRPPASWNTSEKRFVAQLEEILDDLYRRFNRLRLEDMSPGYRKEFKGLQDGVSMFEQTAHNITAEVSSSQIYRASSELELIAQLDGYTPARAIEPGLIWYDMTNRLFKRCVSIEPTVWEVAETNALKTSYWEIRDDGATVGSSGSLDMLAGSRLNLRGPGFGISTDHASGVLLWGGGDNPTTAPLALYRDGTMRNGANIDTLTFSDEASASKPMTIPLVFPSDLYAIDTVKLYVMFEDFRATATGAASGGGSEKTSRSGGASTETSEPSGSGTTGAKADFSTEPNDAYTSGTASPSTDSNSDATGPSSALSTALSGTGSTGGPSTANTGAKAEDTTGSNNSYTSGTSSPGTSTDGSHYHTITNHRHQVTLIPGSSNTVNTTYTQPGATTDGSHSHTVNSHSHSIGAHTHSIPSHSHTLNSHTHAGPSHDHGMAHTHNLGGHSHTVNSHSHSIGAHTHIVPAHSHSLNNHTHSVSIPAHTHIVDIDPHTHDLVYGIYEAGKATSCDIRVDGVLTAAGVGEQLGLDVAGYFSKTSGKITRDTKHTLTITPNALTRIKVQVVIKGAIVTKVTGSL